MKGVEGWAERNERRERKSSRNEVHDATLREQVVGDVADALAADGFLGVGDDGVKHVVREADDAEGRGSIIRSDVGVELKGVRSGVERQASVAVCRD